MNISKTIHKIWVVICIIAFLSFLIWVLTSCATHREAKQAQKYWFYQEIEKDKKEQVNEEKRREPIVDNRYVF